MDASAFLFDAPPAVVETLCRILDCGHDRLGWRGLAVRVLPSLLEVRMLERVEAAGRSPTRELLWSWAQENPRVQDLLTVLQDMGHHKALQLLRGPAASASAGEHRPPAITFQDVVEGTGDFHPAKRVAEGHFSDVYRAQMGSREVAVKLFKQTNVASWKKLWDVFRKEMEIHHLYQHPNILELLCCFSEEGRYCLVQPFLPNGSLFGRLHRQDVSDSRACPHGRVAVQDAEPPLSWQQRLSIIKGTAKALHHLHTAPPGPLVCANVSSANILLDDGLQPKLSIWGSAGLRPRSANQKDTVSLDTRPHSSRGYRSEEDIRDGKLSCSLDVYSFGMVIMETMTGRKVTEDEPKATALRDLLVSEVEDSGGVDSCLQFLDETAGRWPPAMALDLLRMALDCAASRRRSRPSMENVLPALSRLLPPPSGPPADQLRSLVHRDPCDAEPGPLASVPVEHDERRGPAASPADEGPRECSQSEVTYLSDAGGADLYGSWPVQCSCPAEAGGPSCEDCRANGFTSERTDGPQDEFLVVENAAKQRLRNQLSLYDRGLLHTQELFSDVSLQ
ncbi:interleukin-1 receptor-associated kinase 3 [Clinocottus analis]|uniref:interleukin-1 receptor-associated kinase 3 n=1 Tax=Clinocottus analis TaxID=304258 RepID=UPI0035C05C30